MSANLPISSQSSAAWSQDAVLEKGIQFLRQKKDGLKIFQDLKDTAQKTDYYCNSSITAAKKVKDVAEQSRKEIEILEKAAIQFLTVESVKDPSSEQTKRLSKIVSTTHCGLEYFTSVINNTHCPSSLDQHLRNAWLLNNKILPWTFIFTATSFVIEESRMIYRYTPYANAAYISCGTSIITFIASNAIRYLNRYYVDTPRLQHIHSMKDIFERALSSSTN